MIDYLIGVDGGGSGTRVRLESRAGVALARSDGGPSGLAHGIDNAWCAIDAAVHAAFAAAGLVRAANGRIAIGLGLAGVNNAHWRAAFEAANPGYAALRLDTDAYTTLIGAHEGRPGAIVAIGTGSVGLVMASNGALREVGGWGFPAGDEASGAWIGMRAISHIEQVLDGRAQTSPFSDAVISACGGQRDALFAWLAAANQTAYATLAPLVLAHADSDPGARAMLVEAGAQIAALAAALDPAQQLPLALCGGLGEPLRAWLPAHLAARCTTPRGDSSCGALRMLRTHLALA